MVCIYLIEDINDLKYVGSTKSKLNVRLSQHKYHKKIQHHCSSNKLNLYNSIITELEKCNEENRKEREQYWINKIDCVNQLKLNFDLKQYHKEYREKNKEEIKEYKKEYNKEHYEKNKEEIKIKNKEYNKLHWYCQDCKCIVKKCNKSHHLKSQKHHLNTNNYI